MQSDLFYKYYNLLFQKKDYQAETDLLFDLSSKNGLENPKKVLEIGCGTGNHTINLAKHDIDLVAIDIDPEMVKKTQEKLKDGGFKNVIVKEVSVELLDDQDFELVTAMFNVITYLPDTRALVSFMKGVSKSLKVGRVFIFDCWNGVAAIKDPPVSKHTETEQDGKKVVCDLTSTADLMNQQVTLTYRFSVKEGSAIDKGEYSFNQTLWTPMQIRNSLEEAGLREIICAPLMKPDQKATEDDWKIMFLVKKV